MTTPTTSIRVPVKKQLTELLRAAPALEGAQVIYGSPIAEIQRTSVWVGEIDGQLETGPLKAGRKPRDDKFAITVHVFAMTTDTDGQAADELAEALWAAIEDVVAGDPKATLGGVPGLNWAIVSGPSLGPSCSTDGDGTWLSYRSGTISCHARLN